MATVLLVRDPLLPRFEAADKNYQLNFTRYIYTKAAVIRSFTPLFSRLGSSLTKLFTMRERERERERERQRES